MNSSNQTKKITETAVIISIMVVFGLIGFFTFPIINVLYPIPAIVLGYRQDVKYSVLAVIASGILIGILTNILTGVFLLIGYGALGIVLAYMISKKYKPYKILLAGTVTSLVSTLIVIYVIQIVTGVQFVEQLNNLFTESLDIQIKFMESMGLSNYELSTMKEMFNNTIKLILTLVPTLIIITAVFTSYICYWISLAVLKRMRYNVPSIPKFKNFRLPNNIIFGVAIIFLATFMLKYINLVDYGTVFSNVVVLTFFIFFMQGMAVISFFMDKVNMNRVIKVILVVFVLLYSPLMILISLMGLTDSIFNLRKLGNV
ncbi:YybS family protein [Caldisalinibacter kiritimatiensis]|nr:YybS family protein [Caldisalinibacter kiritimatiensis]